MTGKTEPRLYTKELRPLTEETSLGYACIEYASRILRKQLYPFQEWALIHALEIVGDLDGDWRFRFRIILFMIARQNGKTTLSEIICSFFLNVLRVEDIFGTSLSLEKAEEVWEAVIRDQEKYPELSKAIDRISRTNGKKRLDLTGDRSYKVGAPSRRAGRGDSNDLVMLDELRELRDWETWSAAAASTTAKPNGLIICFTNAGDPDSIVLRQLRAQALGQRVDLGGDVDANALALFEWSAQEGSATDDPEALAQANPALGYGLLTERALMANRATYPEQKFRSECMCQQVETILPPPFPDGAWDAGTDVESFIAADADLFFGIDLSQDRRWTSIGVCGLREDGNWHIETVARRVGTEWAIDWFRQRAVKGRMKLAFQSRGAPVSGLAEQICTIQGIERIGIEGADLSNGWGRFYDGVAACLPDGQGAKICHLPQPVMDTPGHTMQLKLMGGGVKLPDLVKSPDDIAPLFACVMAFSAASKPTTTGKIYESAYESGSSLTFI
jgi:hypothetical protein